MVRQDSQKSRITPKGTQPKGGVGGDRISTPSGVTHTPVNVDGPSHRIVPIVMFGALIAGTVMIIVNYLPHGYLGMPSNWYLLGGLGLVLIGIVAATQYR